MNLFKKVSALDAAKNIVFAFSAAKITKNRLLSTKKTRKMHKREKFFVFVSCFTEKMTIFADVILNTIFLP